MTQSEAMDSERRPVLCIDLGATGVAAARRVGRDAPVPVPLGRSGPTMPTAVFADGSTLVVGEEALRQRDRRPDAVEESPRSRIAEADIELGDRPWPVVDVLATVLAHVRRAAADAAGASGSGAFDTVILTHPDMWAGRRTGVLQAAAERAGIRREQIRLVPQSLAAAWYQAYRGTEVGEGRPVCVVDIGADTCDVSVLHADGTGGFTVTDAHSAAVAGRDIDGRLTEWVLEEAAHLDPALPELIRTSGEEIALADAVRAAKEALSEAAQTSVVLPGVDRSLLLTRREFEEMIAPVVARIVGVVTDALADVDGEPVLYPIGGTSAIPAVASALAAIGRVVQHDDPRTVVAQGGLLPPVTVRRTPARGTQARGIQAGGTQAPAPIGHRITAPVVEAGAVVEELLCAPGQSVRTGQPLARIRVAQGVLALESPVDGVLAAIDLRPGVPLRPGVVFAAIGTPGLSRETWPGLHRVPAVLTAGDRPRARGGRRSAR
ncbi:Hsp70 family protein [Gordonia desulfuricans]|uniref:Hsp70 family protein n=1 Tax=Gordonia desulfuricans TaxID=89051 RepID=A0A7K3LJR8_9ACTN|nr:Hsp70 family protein [Gordonia desulfuricans]NDK88486.1 Hsp70 family protein [Gordonia desulfuricans]